MTNGKVEQRPLAALIIEDSETAAKLIARELWRAGYVLEVTRVADVGRLRDEVGFTPAYSLQEGLQQTIAWWSQAL